MVGWRDHEPAADGMADDSGTASPGSTTFEADPGTERAAPRRTAPVGRWAQSLASALIALWVLAALLSFLLHVEPVYTLSVLGLLFSIQATYYKHKLSIDPAYAIPGCKCGGMGSDRTEAVLSSRASEVLRVPASVFGAIAYAVLLYLFHEGRTDAALLVAFFALLASVYLAYVMVARIRALCSLCISTCAANVLLVWYLAR